MELFSPSRPEVFPGQKALLLDGSAVPHIVVRCVERQAHHNYDLVQICAYLRNYNAGSNFTYTLHVKEILLIGLEAFFLHYNKNPEDALKEYFNWTPQDMRVKGKPKLTLVANTGANALAIAEAKAKVKSSLDLL